VPSSFFLLITLLLFFCVAFTSFVVMATPLPMVRHNWTFTRREHEHQYEHPTGTKCFFCPVRHSKSVQQGCVSASQWLGCCWWRSVAFRSSLNDTFRDVFSSQGEWSPVSSYSGHNEWVKLPKGATVVECKDFYLTTLFLGRIFQLYCWNLQTFIFTRLILHRTLSVTPLKFILLY
jgi:hypothetical protein